VVSQRLNEYNTHSVTISTFEASALLAVNCLANEFPSSLNPHDIGICGTSFAITMYSSYRAVPTPWALCKPVLSISSHIWGEDLKIRERIIRPLYHLLAAIKDHQDVLLDKAQIGFETARRVSIDHSNVKATLASNENQVLEELEHTKINIQDQMTAVWYRRPFMVSRLENVHKTVSLQGQIRNLNEIDNAHRNAEIVFVEAVDILLNMRKRLNSLASYTMGLRVECNAREWYSLKRQLQDLPLLVRLKFQDTQSVKVNKCLADRGKQDLSECLNSN
jgi:hypothetical protein